MVPTPEQTMVHSYLFLRRVIGGVGMALPVVLIVGQFLLTGELLTSISGYYYGDLRDVFVGGMCAAGVFLLCYYGKTRTENFAGYVAGAGAIGLALCPTRPVNPTEVQQALGIAHVVCAAVFFLTLAYFCIGLFPEPVEPGTRQEARNRVYRACGWTILACLVLIVLSGRIFEEEIRALRPILWLESAATFAFGVAWMIKGHTLLRDKPAVAAEALTG
ncbi:DUF998 domain-containing protein [Amycolatopsis sp. cg5]|uniref:DUF998 domain-containing protein n=1 Tax=Amycolatopsis sp. cg5 TaxID=3238802 RepID=UPI00352670C2